MKNDIQSHRLTTTILINHRKDIYNRKNNDTI